MFVPLSEWTRGDPSASAASMSTTAGNGEYSTSIASSFAIKSGTFAFHSPLIETITRDASAVRATPGIAASIAACSRVAVVKSAVPSTNTSSLVGITVGAAPSRVAPPGISPTSVWFFFVDEPLAPSAVKPPPRALARIRVPASV